MEIKNFRYDFRYDLLCKPSEGTGSQVKNSPKIKVFNKPSEPIKSNCFALAAVVKNISNVVVSNSQALIK